MKIIEDVHPSDRGELGSSKGWVTLAKAGLNCVRHCVRAGIGFELPLSEGDEEDEDEEDDEAMDEE